MQTFKILALGPSGSGKTVFLGSMYHRLAIQEEDIGFFLKTDAQQRLGLINIYNQIASAKDEWPDATQYRNIETWHFTCSTKAVQGVYDAFQFSYLDYAGERLTTIRRDEPFSEDFAKELQEADTYLGLLDGRKIFELMLGTQGDDELVDEFVRTDLPSLLTIMEQDIKPIHFIITKWDLLEGKYNLSQVRNRLLEIPQFKAFVTTNAKRLLIRLIPVSSVGSGFADLLGDRMVKKAGAFPRPFQVEMTLACVLLDYFQARLTELEEERREKSIIILPRRKSKVSVMKAVELWTKRTAHSLLRNFPRLKEMLGLDEKTFQDILNFLKEDLKFLEYDIQKRREEAEQRLFELEEKQRLSLEAVEDERTAIKHTVDSFMALQVRLEKEFPESILQEGKNL